MSEDKSSERYINYVLKQIDELKKISDLIRDDFVLPVRVNNALARFEPIALGLNSEYQRVKSQHKTMKRHYQNWWDEKFLAARDKLNEGRTSSKYASKAEIDSQTRHDNKEKYNDWQEKLDEQEMQVRFMIRLIDDWKSEVHVLRQLSQNLQTEMKSLYVGDGRNDLPSSMSNRRIRER